MENEQNWHILQLVTKYSDQEQKIEEQNKLIEEMKWLLGHAIRIAKNYGQEEFLKTYMGESSLPYCQRCQYILEHHPKNLCKCGRPICDKCIIRKYQCIYCSWKDSDYSSDDE